MSRGPRSKTLATWIAVAGGAFGLHRFYLHGPRDAWAWLFSGPTLAGAYGIWRMDQLGVDDRLSWLLIPLVGLTITAAMLAAIVYGLTPDEKWNAHHNPRLPAPASGWAVIFGVMLALMLGGGVLMATLAFVGEHYFVVSLEAEREAKP